MEASRPSRADEMNYALSSTQNPIPNPLLVFVPKSDRTADGTLRFNSSELKQRIRAFVARKGGVPLEDVRPESRLLHDLRIDGERAADLLVEFSISLEVDMDGFAFSRFFYERNHKSPFRFWARRNRKRLPLTVDDLFRAALRGKFTHAAADV